MMHGMMKMNYCVEFVNLKMMEKRFSHTGHCDILSPRLRKTETITSVSIGHTGVGAEHACTAEGSTLTT